MAPTEIVVVQRGIRFAVDLLGGGAARGYVLELFQGHFRLPDLGPIGALCCANISIALCGICAIAIRRLSIHFAAWFAEAEVVNELELFRGSSGCRTWGPSVLFIMFTILDCGNAGKS